MRNSTLKTNTCPTDEPIEKGKAIARRCENKVFLTSGCQGFYCSEAPAGIHPVPGPQHANFHPPEIGNVIIVLAPNTRTVFDMYWRPRMFCPPGQAFLGLQNNCTPGTGCTSLSGRPIFFSFLLYAEYPALGDPSG